MADDVVNCYLKHRRLAVKFFFSIVLRENHINVECLSYLVTDYGLGKSGNICAVGNVEFLILCCSALEFHSVYASLVIDVNYAVFFDGSLFDLLGLTARELLIDFSLDLIVGNLAGNLGVLDSFVVGKFNICRKVIIIIIIRNGYLAAA